MMCCDKCRVGIHPSNHTKLQLPILVHAFPYDLCAVCIELWAELVRDAQTTYINALIGAKEKFFADEPATEAEALDGVDLDDEPVSPAPPDTDPYIPIAD